VILLCEGIAKLVPVLMTGNPLEFEVVSVEEESLVPVHVIIPESYLILGTVNFLTVFEKGGDGGI